MLTFLIMAGGSGERFWPLSTKQKPKQLLKIFNEKSLIRLTYDRILPLTNKDNIFIATNAIQVKALKAELREVDDSRIIIEPGFKDTASAIAYGSMIISKYFDNPTICVLASDHLIAKEEEFRNVIRIAEKEAINNNIVTLGIKPSYPETGYGYIKVNNCNINTPTKSLGFREKPQLDIAKVYFNSGNYLWNSGMFIFKYSVIMEALKKYSSIHYDVTLKINEIVKINEGVITANKVVDLFNLYEKKSIDFAVMEKANNVMVIPSDFGWNDVGNYLAFEELFDKDVENNIVKDINCISIDSANNIIIGQNTNQTLSLLGINNMIVVVTKDNILICAKDKNQEIKQIIKKLN